MFGALAMLIIATNSLAAQTIKMILDCDFEDESQLNNFSHGKDVSLQLTTDAISGNKSLLITKTKNGGGDILRLAEAFNFERNGRYFVTFTYRADKTIDTALEAPGTTHWMTRRAKEPLKPTDIPNEVNHIYINPDTFDNYVPTFRSTQQCELVIDNFKVFQIEEEVATSPPVLKFPIDGSSIVPAGSSLAIEVDRTSLPVRAVDAQLSQDSSFNGPIIEEMIMAKASKSISPYKIELMGKQWRSNAEDNASKMLDELPEGQWFVRMSNLGQNNWSPTYTFTVKNKPPAAKRYNISPTNPLLRLRAAGNRSLTNPIQVWNNIPDKLKPYSSGQHFELSNDFLTNNNIITGGKGKHDIPLSEVEASLQRLPTLAFWDLTEYFRPGDNDENIQFFDSSVKYMRRMIKLASAYGCTLVIVDNNNGGNGLYKATNDPETVKMLQGNKDYIWGVAKGNGTVPFPGQSIMLGLWMSDCSSGWGYHAETWYWTGFHDINEVDVPLPQRTYRKELYPYAFHGIFWLMCASAGGTIYDVEDRCFDPDTSEPYEGVSNYVFPLMEKLLEWNAIPSKDEVISSTMPVMFKVRENDSVVIKNDKESTGGMSRDVAKLYNTAYGSWSHRAELMPDKPARALLPLIPAGVDDTSLPQTIKERLIPASMIDDPITLNEKFDSTTMNNLIKGHNTYCVKINNKIYAVNASENWDRDAEVEVELEAPFESIKLELPVHSYALIVQDGNELKVHCNGYRRPDTIRPSHGSWDRIPNPSIRVNKNSLITVTAAKSMTAETETPASVNVLTSGKSTLLEIIHANGFSNFSITLPDTY